MPYRRNLNILNGHPSVRTPQEQARASDRSRLIVWDIQRPARETACRTKGILFRPNLRLKKKSYRFQPQGKTQSTPPRFWDPAPWSPQEARGPRQKRSCISPLPWGWRRTEMQRPALDMATQGWTPSQCTREMPMLIKCHLNYFCQGYKKKLETPSLGHLLLIAIYKSSVFGVIHGLFPLKTTSKAPIGTPNGNVTHCPTRTLRSAWETVWNAGIWYQFVTI